MGMTMNEAQQIRQELAEHKADTKEILVALSQNVSDLTKTVTKIQIYQAELNTSQQELAAVKADVKQVIEKVADIDKKTAVNESFVSNANKLVWGVSAAVILIFIKIVLDVAQ